MNESQYSSALVQLLSTRFLPSIQEAALAHPIGKMFWQAIEPQIPEWLAQLDGNKEMQQGIIRHLREFMYLVEEDPRTESLEEEKGGLPIEEPAEESS